MSMTLAELMDHTRNLEGLLTTKRHQVSHMKIDTVARKRHELAITALEGRVREIARAVDVLRGDEPTLQLMCVGPGVPPLANVIGKAQTISDLPAAPRDLCS